MRTKDQILLESMYLKTKTLINEELQDDNIFTAEVNLNIYDLYPHEEVDYNIPQKTKVSYRLDIEYGSTGIRGINATLVKVSPVTVERTTYKEGNEDQVDYINLDLTGASFIGPVASDKYGQVVATAIEIYLKEDYSVERAELIF